MINKAAKLKKISDSHLIPGKLYSCEEELSPHAYVKEHDESHRINVVIPDFFQQEGFAKPESEKTPMVLYTGESVEQLDVEQLDQATREDYAIMLRTTNRIVNTKYLLKKIYYKFLYKDRVVWFREEEIKSLKRML